MLTPRKSTLKFDLQPPSLQDRPAATLPVRARNPPASTLSEYIHLPPPILYRRSPLTTTSANAFVTVFDVLRALYRALGVTTDELDEVPVRSQVNALYERRVQSSGHARQRNGGSY